MTATMTYHDLLDRFWHSQLSLDEWAAAANAVYPVAATPPARVYVPLHELAPTWMAMQAADVATTELQAA